MTKKCDNNCCNEIFGDYDDIGDDYDIQRLQDIITICEFLIKTKKHRIQKRKNLNDLFEECERQKEEEEAQEKDYRMTNTDIPLRVYKYKYPKNYIPYWDQFWF